MNIEKQLGFKVFHEFSGIPLDIVSNGISRHLSVGEIVSLAYASRTHYGELIEKHKNLWHRVFSEGFPYEIASNPVLFLFTIVDGFRQLSYGIALLRANKGLFSDDFCSIYSTKAIQDLYVSRSDIRIRYQEKLPSVEDIVYLMSGKSDCIQLRNLSMIFQMEHEITKSKHAIFMHFLATFLKVTLMTTACLLGGWVLFANQNLMLGGSIAGFALFYSSYYDNSPFFSYLLRDVDAKNTNPEMIQKAIKLAIQDGLGLTGSIFTICFAINEYSEFFHTFAYNVYVNCGFVGSLLILVTCLGSLLMGLFYPIVNDLRSLN